jgi:hypothetical protein
MHGNACPPGPPGPPVRPGDSVQLMAMGGLDPAISLADNYRVWAREARGRSPAYATLSNAVADDIAILGFLGTLPPDKRQPNLLFASAWYLLGAPADPDALRDLVRRDPDGLSQVMRTRRTQTNEPARCATLLPALARLPEPLALIEVGASAGLTLLFDRYTYDYGDLVIAGPDPEAPTLRCGPRGPVPVPARVPEIAWRAGLDLNPLDVTSDDDMRWLACMVWPDEGDRAERLAAAVATARRSPPPVYRGDLLTDLPALVAQAPAGATVVVYHSAVLAGADLYLCCICKGRIKLPLCRPSLLSCRKGPLANGSANAEPLAR